MLYLLSTTSFLQRHSMAFSSSWESVPGAVPLFWTSQRLAAHLKPFPRRPAETNSQFWRVTDQHCNNLVYSAFRRIFYRCHLVSRHIVHFTAQCRLARPIPASFRKLDQLLGDLFLFITIPTSHRLFAKLWRLGNFFLNNILHSATLQPFKTMLNWRLAAGFLLL